MTSNKTQQEINILKNKGSIINVNQNNYYSENDEGIEFNEERFKNIIELFLENKSEIIIEKDKYQNFKRNQAEKHKKNKKRLLAV